MHTAKNESLRRAMYLKFNTRAFPDNEEVLLQILRHRWDKARLLGYADFAELATSGNMVRNASRVQHYLNTIGALLEDAVDSEMMMLNSSTATHGVNVFKPYNYAYGHALYSNLSFALNSTEVRLCVFMSNAWHMGADTSCEFLPVSKDVDIEMVRSCHICT
eukprot:m.199390 g.199390  ORF g.199390 m.199390 type:complete len:162 (+) comp18778_c0_seq16:1853-2338(+)